MSRRLAALFVLAALGSPLLAQSPAEVAEREKERRKQLKDRPAKVYTNDDLERRGAPSPSPPSRTASPGSVTGSGSGSEGQSSQEGESPDDEATWRMRAEGARAAVKQAENQVRALEAKLESLRQDMDPGRNVMDPFRLQTLEAERAKAAKELEAARAARAAARKALEDLPEQARRAGVPPGWIREP